METKILKIGLICKVFPLLFLISSSISGGAQDIDEVTLDIKAKEDAQQAAIKRPERITVVAPKHLRPQSDYHVLVNLANSEQPASIDLQLTGGRDSNREQTEAKSVLVKSGETQTVKFSIGDWLFSAEYILSVNAQAIDRSWNFSQEAVLIYHPKTFTTFIQTDKAIYKPGQTVQFRVLTLTQELTPLVMKEEINVTVSDAKRNIIKQWTGLSNWRGLLSLDFPLSEEPVLGDWTIKVEARNQEADKRFLVAEYILPTFAVNIQLPPYATYNESDIVATVRASYTYGKPVNGHVTLTVQPLIRFAYLDTRPLEETQFRARLVNGSADISFDLVKDLKQKPQDFYERDIEFFALVEEDLTGRKYNKTEVIKIYDKDIKIDHLNPDDQSFKPGLGYLAQLKIAYQDDTPVENNGPPVEVKFEALDQHLETVKLQPVNGLVEHLIQVPKKVAAPSLPDEKITPTNLNIRATYRGQTHQLSYVDAYASESEHYMQINLPQLQGAGSSRRKRSRPSINVNDELRVQVQATEGMQQVTCQGLARGDIIWALSPDAKNKTEFEFEIKIDQRMAPEMRILCFYIRPDNKEIIADSTKVSIGGLMKNLVKVSASREEAKPGQQVEVNVFTKPNSLVGVLGVDQSVLLLRSGNDISAKDVANEVKSYGSLTPSSLASRNTEGMFDKSDVVVLTNNVVHKGWGNRFGRLLYNNAFVMRPMMMLEAAPARLIKLDTLVQNSPLPPPDINLKKRGEEPLVIRSFFPETWLWSNATAGQDGSASFKAKVPDTITSWELSAFSMSESSGFGLSQGKTSVRVFRPFFVKLNLPYSIIRGETVSIQAVVFNYAKRPTQARVTLDNANGDFEFVEAANTIEDEKHSASESQSRLVRVPAEDGVSVSFLITPRKLGHIDVKVTARGEQAGDGLVRKLLVKPEGQTQFLNKAMLINLDAESSQIVSRNISIQVPANAVPGSQKVFVSAIGDLMGAGLSNVDDLLRLPYGCGEQNMINLVPNIVIMNYLQNTRRLRDNQRARAIKNIETGYQRQLNYMRKDGSFSAFGDSDNNGSVWLTAYVLKSFQQAKSLITIDERVIQRAGDFLSRFSRSDGSFEEVGMVHHKALQSTQAGDSPSSIYLTAYSTIALLQKSIKQPATVALDEVLEKALGFLERELESAITEAQDRDSPYNLAIIAYTLNLARRQPAMNRAYEKLWASAQEKDDLVWWEAKKTDDRQEQSGKLRAGPDTSEREFESVGDAGATTRPNKTSSIIPPLKPLLVTSKQSAHLFVPDSLSIEMTALALLTTVRQGELERALPIVRWLISQQNSNGGFASTQDTVLAIEALAAFAEANAAAKKPVAVNIDIVYPRESAPATGGTQRLNSNQRLIQRNNVDQLSISSSNALVNQQIRLENNASWVQVNASGSGAAVVQVSWQYNLLVSAEKPAFYLSPNLDRTSNSDYLQLSVCTSYTAGNASNMAVMDIELPSGYVADAEALPGLTSQDKSIKRTETAQGDTRVLIYLDQVTNDKEVCVTVPAHRTSKVSNNKPVPVSIYDYYDRQKAARIFYEPPPTSSCDICEANTCSENCSSKPKKVERLVSLHEQRNLARSTSGSSSNMTLSHDNLRVENATVESGNDTLDATRLLPLAPVQKLVVSVAKKLYNGQ